MDKRPGGRPYFERDPEFSVDKIYSFRRLGPESTVDDVVRDAYDTFAFTYDFNHPLWGVPLYEYANRKSMLVFRLHHTVTDGQGFGKAWIAWSQSVDGHTFRTAPIPNPLFSEPPAAPFPPTEAELEILAKSGERDVERYGSVRLSPHHNSVEKRQHGVKTRQLGRSGAIPLAELKRFKKVLGCDGLNDTVTAMVAGAFSKVLRRKDLPIDEYFCFVVPVSFRDHQQDPDLCNRIGFYILYIPSSIDSIVQRARTVSQITSAAKNGSEAEIMYRNFASQVCPWDVPREVNNRMSISNVPEAPYAPCEFF